MNLHCIVGGIFQWEDLWEDLWADLEEDLEDLERDLGEEDIWVEAGAEEF